MKSVDWLFEFTLFLFVCNTRYWGDGMRIGLALRPIQL